MEKFSHGTNGNWIKLPENPLLGGDLGTCFDVSMIKEEDRRILMYFSWRDKASIALTESTDGIHWSDPRICIGPRKSKMGREDDLNRPSVVKIGTIYHMWYVGQFKPGVADGTSDIFHAVSEDGVHFTRTSDEPVLSAGEEWEKHAVMNPSVLYDEKNGIFRMWYSAGEQYEPTAIGYAESVDGLVWKKSPLNPIFHAEPSNEWEKHKTAGCHVIFHKEMYWMFYIGYHNENYAQIGVARSKNGVTDWERSRFNPIIAPDEGAWDADACYKPFVLNMGDCWMLWYNGRRGSKEQIGGALLNEKELTF